VIQFFSAIEDLVRLLALRFHGVQLTCVHQTIYNEDALSFIKQVNILTQYLKVPYIIIGCLKIANLASPIEMVCISIT